MKSKRVTLTALAALAFPASMSAPAEEESPGMVWIPAGTFTMGTDEAESYPAERPAHRVTVDGFWMDETEVTNEQFSQFVEATGYVTLAERIPDWEQLRKQLPDGTPKPPPEKFVAGSLVFSPPTEPVSVDDPSLWWTWMPGASWRHPEGPHSNLDGRSKHPVVQVSWEDAVAYATWAGKRLPTEAEWEFAARGGLEGKRYAWGNEFKPGGNYMANIWQGMFPDRNTKADGFVFASPVKSFPPNGYGLFDMIGNVWEWCSDRFDATLYESAARGVGHDPNGPGKSDDSREPHAAQRVTKGGSFLCAENYCVNFRPSARRGTDWDTGMSHLGFRCVKSADRHEKIGAVNANQEEE